MILSNVNLLKDSICFFKFYYWCYLVSCRSIFKHYIYQVSFHHIFHIIVFLCVSSLGLLSTRWSFNTWGEGCSCSSKRNCRKTHRAYYNQSKQIFLKTFVLAIWVMILIHARKFFQYWEKAEFPFELVPKLAQLKVSGGTIQVCSFSFCKENIVEKNLIFSYHQNGSF